MEIADIFRFLGSIVPLITSVLQFFTELRKRDKWTRETQNELNSFGWVYWIIDVLPNTIFKFLLGLIILASLVSIVEGAYKVTNNKSLSIISDFLFRNSLWIAAIWFILAVIIYFNIVPRILLKLFSFYPEMNYKPGWINAKWHIESAEDAKPINVSETGYKAVANNLVKALESIDEFSGDRAKRPDDITNDEAANMFLIGCVIEGKIYDLNFTLTWKNFYDALGRAALHTERPFSPESIKKSSAGNPSFYKRLIDLCKPYELPDEPSIALTVKEVIDRLNNSYDGSARRLAFSFWRRKASIKTAAKRAAKIPRLNGTKHESMRTQFLKLAVGHGVWEGVKTSPFVFPFSTGIAEMFFNKRCLITMSSVNSIAIVKDVEHLVAYTEKLIVDEVNQILQKSSSNEMQIWTLSYEVDYLLWYLARHPNMSEEVLVQRGVSDTSWQLEGNSIVRK